MNTAEIINARRLIDGPKNDLMCVSPLKHKWAWEVLEKMEENTWFTKEVDFTNDKFDFKFKLTDAERSMYLKALAFLSNLDGIQFNNLVNNIGQHITSPEVSMCVSRQAWEEALHVKSYALMIENVAEDPMSIYMMFENDPILAKKNEHILRQSRIIGTQYSKRAFVLATVSNIILEGIYFFSGFLAFYCLAKNGKMLNSADMIRLIQRDEEGTHLELFLNMFYTLQREEPEVFTPDLWEDIKQLFKDAVELETAWGCHIISGGVLGMTDAIVGDYIKHLANKRCAKLGMPEIYPGVKNPVEWVEKFSDVNYLEQNFFESKNVVYQVGGALDW